MELKTIIEAVLFNSQKPLSPKELRDVLAQTAENSEEPLAKSFKKTKDEELIAVLETLAQEHEAAARTFRLVCVAGAWQFVSQPEFAPWIKTLVGEKSRPGRLSQPALETLAIIAYRQPLTRAEIEQIRGVAVDGVMQTLLERGIVEQTGRAEVVGRPALYGTTPAFLEYFGLRGLEDLPAADELRKIPVKKPEALLTVEPGLATAPPEQLALQEVTPRETAPPEVATSEPRTSPPTEPPPEAGRA
ncbi:MAG: Chromosome segregation and condensation protein ScpB [Limisphaerales bacterium]|nr:MAG: Chromosome segregation and condensation protein ScpB [Limisphaerales bacterium]KAG0507655.1 MAG: Chromosome segregation and condensation protein ScpB [Limisphaerales bacterium]TXT51774.1 MAG: Chromosome segregation and condensation protein ScpB [Limisphaerales bacterium]